mgnify:CR=1 FL=1
MAQAAVLLANAGHAGGAGLPEIKIQVTPSGQNIAVANAVKTQWQAIGVNAAVVEVPFGDFRTEVELPATVDESQVDAEYSDGFLRIRLPKLKPRRIDIAE